MVHRPTPLEPSQQEAEKRSSRAGRVAVAGMTSGTQTAPTTSSTRPPADQYNLLPFCFMLNFCGLSLSSYLTPYPSHQDSPITGNGRQSPTSDAEEDDNLSVMSDENGFPSLKDLIFSVTGGIGNCLHVACSRGHLQIVEFLCTRKSTPASGGLARAGDVTGKRFFWRDWY